MATVAVQSLDIQVFRGITFKLDLEFREIDENEVDQGPFDLSGSVLGLIIEDILATDLTLLSSEPPDTNGSYIDITDAVGGLVSIKLTDETLANIRKQDGSWRLVRLIAGDIELFTYGAAQVLSYTNNGEV